MKSLFLESSIYIIGLCKANSGLSGELPAATARTTARDLQLSAPSLPPAAGPWGGGVRTEAEVEVGSKEGTSVVRPASCGSLGPS